MILDDDALDPRNDTHAEPAHHLHYSEIMQDADAIVAINFEQLATVTDRLLLRGGLAKKHPSAPRIEVSPEMTLHMRQSEHWRRFTTLALLTALFSVTTAIVSLL